MALGALLAGRGDLAGAVLTLGGVAALGMFVLWSYARTFGPRNGDD